MSDRRTNKDKRMEIICMLQSHDGANWSDRAIAERCGVDHTTVAKYRRMLESADRPIRKVYRQGLTYEMDVTGLRLRANEVPGGRHVTAMTDGQIWRPSNGFVYLVRSSLCKIGMAEEPASRLKSYFSSLPGDVEVLHLIESNDVRWAETQLHSHFSNRNVKGEWFALNAADIEWIKSLKRLDRPSK